LKGSKAYIVEGELGYETTTLDMEGNVTRNALFDHVTAESIADIIPEFTGSIRQVPPIYSAIQKDGKRMYKEARRGAKEEDLQLEPRTVYVHQMDLLDVSFPRFRIRVECGGGVYIRSLIRDMGRRLDSAATTYSLVRTKHGPFTLEQCLARDDWSGEKIYDAIANSKTILEKN
jgi:tRNA pseudouridine55 synthase